MIKKIPFHEIIAQAMLSEHGRPIPLAILVNKIRKNYDVKNARQLEASINAMINDGELKQLNVSKSIKIQHLIGEEVLPNTVHHGILHLNSHGHGIVELEDNKEAIFYIHKTKLNNALNVDTVEIEELKEYPSVDEKIQFHMHDAQVDKIIVRKKHLFSGTFHKDNEHHTYFIDVDDPKFYLPITLKEWEKVPNDTKILMDIDEFDDNGAIAKVKKEIGSEDKVGTDISGLVYDAGFEPEFSSPAQKQADELKIDWDPIHPSSRRDLTKENFVTIDPKESKDFDDSFNVRELDDGSFILNVAIADVGNFVRFESPLFKEALRRSTSLYLPDRTIPMYPLILSDDLCSINPNVVRYVINCEMHIDSNGKLLSTNAYPAAIISKRRFNYDEVNAYFADPNSLPNDSQAIKDMLNTGRKLHEILRKKRTSEGFIDFDIKEPIILLDEKGFPYDIKIHQTGIAQRMVEDFMLDANEAITLFALNHKIPFIYRIHDRPEPKKLAEFSKLIRRIPYQSHLDLDHFSSPDLVKWLQTNEHHKKIEIARKLLLQSMSKAIYSEQLADHFGIASKNYTHFTSPIRRFPDTLVSELLHMFVFEPDEYTDDERERIKQKIIDYAKRASDLERLATDLGFDVNEMKFAEYMTQFLGKHFVGTITSVNKFGVFVQLDNTIEGLIHITNMTNDFYNYDEETSTLIGKNTRSELHVGDKVEVEVVGADKHTKKIDFKLIAKLPDEE